MTRWMDGWVKWWMKKTSQPHFTTTTSFTYSNDLVTPWNQVKGKCKVCKLWDTKCPVFHQMWPQSNFY
jgi:hypothetical protein